MITFAELHIPIEHFFYSLLFIVLTLILSKHDFYFIVNKVTMLIGKLSFSMYLTHFFLLDLVKGMMNSEKVVLQENAKMT
ncbi:hypothetical protein PBAT_02055 [Paenibacillus antarcticus]|uniref:Uncharacterized protein n=1 Tax=Paenibacillus antarcticus TaxID=253703 RepID=A0A168R0L8_9BACL|nr:hypothetical protein PBAT_02055 [Paenibacillus antarcticus]